jgi:hypothetical protein
MPRIPGTARSPRPAPSGATPLASSALVKDLRALGYAPEVAARMVQRYPELARRVIFAPRDQSQQRAIRTDVPMPLMNHAAFDGRPQTLFRGVCVSPERFDPRFVDNRIPLLFFSEEIAEPLRYATGATARGRAEALAQGERFGTVIEVQVPGLLTYYYGHPVLRTADVPDLSPFVTRRARVDLTSPPLWLPNPEALTWER